jgi:hypothetical protein
MSGRCGECGQKLHATRRIERRLLRINHKAERLSKSLGRRPRVQTCRKCNRIVLEGQAGFVDNYLLIDME